MITLALLNLYIEFLYIFNNLFSNLSDVALTASQTTYLEQISQLIFNTNNYIPVGELLATILGIASIEAGILTIWLVNFFYKKVRSG